MKKRSKMDVIRYGQLSGIWGNIAASSDYSGESSGLLGKSRTVRNRQSHISFKKCWGRRNVEKTYGRLGNRSTRNPVLGDLEHGSGGHLIRMRQNC